MWNFFNTFILTLLKVNLACNYEKIRLFLTTTLWKSLGKLFYVLVGYDEDDPRKKMIFVRTKHKIVIKTEKNRNFHVDFYWKTCLHLPLWLSHKNSTREQKYNEKWLHRIRLLHDLILTLHSIISSFLNQHMNFK